MRENLKEKFKESFFSVFPIALIVIGLAVTLTPLSSGTFILFVVGVLMLVCGMALFTLGADLSMLVIGQKVGATLTKSKKVWLIAFVSFVIGVIVTIAEPDLQILAEQVPDIENMVLIVTVSVGVGLFLMVAMLRILFGISFSILLAVLYPLVFVLAVFFVPQDFWALSFDSGGVTTGPVTVPFIMSLGVGVAAVRSGRKSGDDSFGLVALSSVGCFRVTHLVNTGIAGSLDAKLDIGDLLVSKDAMYHDFDCVHFGYEMGRIPGMDVTAFPADAQMIRLAKEAAEAVHPGHVTVGRVASGDLFVAEKGAKDRIIAVTGGLCTEMEGAAIAQTAYRNKIPFVILRAISDKADNSAEMDYPTFERIAAHRCAQVTQNLAKQLKAL